MIGRTGVKERPDDRLQVLDVNMKPSQQVGGFTVLLRRWFDKALKEHFVLEQVPADAATSRPTVCREAGEDLAIELGVRLPGLASDYAAIANGLLVDECTSGLLGLKADVFIAGDALAFGESGGGEDLDAVADGEDPFLLRVEFANHIEQAAIIAEVLGSAATQNEDGIVVIYIDLVEREVRLETVAGTLDIGIPPWLEVVHDEMEAAKRRSSNGDAPVFLAKPMNRIKRLVGFASISGNDQYVQHFSGASVSEGLGE
jgi:hypothetical protein